jgi:hypothetical protein
MPSKAHHIRGWLIGIVIGLALGLLAPGQFADLDPPLQFFAALMPAYYLAILIFGSLARHERLNRRRQTKTEFVARAFKPAMPRFIGAFFQRPVGKPKMPR